jgi:lipopolysaccharide cholinephosphotransferase
MEYNDAILHRLQQLELSILDDFMTVCRENGFSWWALCGSGIGALRHQGFIPWDDDIDVGLLRADYDRLNQIFKDRFPDKYVVVNADEFPSFPLSTTRITLKDSLFVEESLRRVKDCPLGIFLDVYAFDNVPPDPALAKKQIRTAWFWSKLMILSAVPFPVLPFSGVRRKLVHAVTAVVWAVLRLFRVSPGRLFRRLKKAATRYNDRPAAAYAYPADTDPYSNYFTPEDLFPLRTLPFEGRQVNFPHNLEKHLEYLYGDYMQLPPVEKRKNHFPSKLKFPGESKVYSGDLTD